MPRLVGVLLGGAIVTLPLLAYLRFDIINLFRDYSMGYAARFGSGHPSGLLVERLLGSWYSAGPEIILLLAFVLWANVRVLNNQVLLTLPTLGVIWVSQTLNTASTSWRPSQMLDPVAIADHLSRQWGYELTDYYPDADGAPRQYLLIYGKGVVRP